MRRLTNLLSSRTPFAWSSSSGIGLLFRCPRPQISHVACFSPSWMSLLLRSLVWTSLPATNSSSSGAAGVGAQPVPRLDELRDIQLDRFDPTPDAFVITATRSQPQCNEYLAHIAGAGDSHRQLFVCVLARASKHRTPGYPGGLTERPPSPLPAKSLDPVTTPEPISMRPWWRPRRGSPAELQTRPGRRYVFRKGTKRGGRLRAKERR